jgi:diguanylate cyclase (GGDEF)-like protein
MQQELEAQYSQLEEANVRLEQLAATDGLTGLANHRAFQEELAHLVARVKRDGKPLSVLLLDVDYFKKYNDSFGHPAGDEVLKTIAQILKQTIRQSDLAARYGGEEFAILLYDADAETAAIVAERSRAAIAAHEFPHREVTVSVGVAVHVVGEEGAVLVQRTDTALYQSKHNGRNRVTVSEVLPFAHAA